MVRERATSFSMHPPRNIIISDVRFRSSPRPISWDGVRYRNIYRKYFCLMADCNLLGLLMHSTKAIFTDPEECVRLSIVHQKLGQKGIAKLLVLRSMSREGMVII